MKINKYIKTLPLYLYIKRLTEPKRNGLNLNYNFCAFFKSTLIITGVALINYIFWHFLSSLYFYIKRLSESKRNEN